jgi:hypothetical protein
MFKLQLLGVLFSVPTFLTLVILVQSLLNPTKKGVRVISGEKGVRVLRKAA